MIHTEKRSGIAAPYSGPERRINGQRRHSISLQNVSPMGWVKFITVLIGIGFAWAHLAGKVDETSQQISAVAESINTARKTDAEWRANLMALRAEDKAEIIGYIRDLQVDDENLQRQITDGSGTNGTNGRVKP